MYAVAKEHRGAKLFVKTRRSHIPQKLNNNFDNNSIKRDAKELQLKELCTISKPLLNGKRFEVNRSTVEISAQHEALIKYINGSWKCIKQELEYYHKLPTGDLNNNITTTTTTTTTTSNHLTLVNNNNSSITNHSNIINSNNVTNAKVVPKIKYINGCTGSSIPKNFVPFDLESFWGQRIYQNLLQSS